MKKRAENTALSLAQLRRYVDGTLNTSAQHEVEKATLSQREVADALEGLAQIKHDQIDEREVFADLQARLRARVREQDTKVVPLWQNQSIRQWISAAVVVLTTGLGWYWFSKFESDVQKTLPTVTQKTQEKVAALPTEKPKIIEESLTITPKKSKKVLVLSGDTTPQIKEDTRSVAVLPQTVFETLPVAQAQPVPTQDLDTVQVTAKRVVAKESLTFSVAKIAPPSNAFWQEVQQNKKDSLPTDRREEQIRAEFEESNNALNEVVVTAYSSKQAATPEGGWEAYRAYLQTEAKRFLAQNPLEKKGRVALQLTIDEQGNIVEIKSTNKAKASLQQAATTMIQAGPKWKPRIRNKQNKSSRVRVIVHFD